MAREKGGFISLEGGEGAGKSTQAARLTARLEAAGREVLWTREPGGSPRAETIRAAILSGAVKPLGAEAEALMFSAARLDHVETRIRPALARGAFVVCDRFVDSTRAYQGALGHVDDRLLRALEIVAVGADRPDLTLIFDLPVADGLARADRRRGAAETPDRFEQEGRGFHDRIRAAFQRIAEAEPKRCRLLDGSLPADALEHEVWRAVADRFPHLGARTPAAVAS